MADMRVNLLYYIGSVDNGYFKNDIMVDLYRISPILFLSEDALY